MRYAPTHGIPQRPTESFRGEFAPTARLPFLPLMEEKEAKEDQGDNRHQVGQIGAQTCIGLHFIRLVSVRGSLGPSRGLRPRTPISFSSLDGRK